MQVPAEQRSVHSLPHRSGWTVRTVFILLAVVALLLLLNVPGARRELERTGSKWAFVEFSDHGWPWIFLTRRQDFDQTPHPPISIWRLASHVESFSPLWLVLNIAVVLLCGSPVIWYLVSAKQAWPVLKWQLSLRTLLLVTALGGMALAATIYLAGRYREQQQFVTALRQLNASVSVIPGGPDWLRDLLPNDYRIFDQYDGINLPAEFLSPVLAAGESDNPFVRLCECPDKMAGIKDMRIVECEEFTDRHFRMLRHASNLENLDISGTGVNGDGFEGLTEHPRLHYFHFRDTFVSDESLHFLSRAPQLRGVGCMGSKVSSQAMARLRIQYSKSRPNPQ